jgi:hypothetical protein
MQETVLRQVLRETDGPKLLFNDEALLLLRGKAKSFTTLVLGVRRGLARSLSMNGIL